jgi:hypothetical protein
MLRRIACAVAVLSLSVGIGLAEELRGRITKIEDGKVTFQTVKFNKEDKKLEVGDAKTYEVAKDVKVFKREGKDKKSDVADGLKAKAFQNIDEKKGVGATINVVDGKVTEITYGGGPPRKGKKDAK